MAEQDSAFNTSFLDERLSDTGIRTMNKALDAVLPGTTRPKHDINQFTAHILKEYEFAYTSNRLVMTFIKLPPAILRIVASFDKNSQINAYSWLTFHSYFAYQAITAKIAGIGSITTSTVGEHSTVTILPRSSRTEEITTDILCYYHKDYPFDHIGYMLQEWLGILGWKSSDLNYNGFIQKLYESDVSEEKSPTNLYKGNILICSYSQCGLKEQAKNSLEKNDLSSLRDVINEVKRRLQGGAGNTEPLPHFPTNFIVEDAYLALGVYPKNITGIADFDRGQTSFREYSITWNVDMLLYNNKIKEVAQSISDEYFKFISYYTSNEL
jgi:hypothetical protein